MSEDHTNNNPGCSSPTHNKHLCFLTERYFHVNNPEEYRNLVQNPKFKCKICGRVANTDQNLCYADIL
jgi:hypothetical protein